MITERIVAKSESGEYTTSYQISNLKVCRFGGNEFGDVLLRLVFFTLPITFNSIPNATLPIQVKLSPQSTQKDWLRKNAIVLVKYSYSIERCRSISKGDSMSQ